MVNKWYKSLKQSKLTPPSWVFGVVWPLLYTLMAIALYFTWTNKKCYPFCNAIIFFFIQLFFNLLWTTLFFKYKLIKLALLDLFFILTFTIITFVKFYEINKYISFLLLPYLLWLLLAFYLNFYIVLNN